MTNRTISRKMKTGLVAVTMTMMAMAMTACGADEETAYQSYDATSSNYTATDDSGYNYDYDYDSSYDSDNSSFNDEYDYEAEADSNTSDSIENTVDAATSFDYDDDWDYETVCDDDYDYDDEDYETVCDDDYDYDDEDFEEALDEEECAGAELDSTADYASDALVRTNEVEFTVESPKVGGTEAELEAEVINRNGGTITMIGCTIYDDMGIALVSWNESCNITDSTFDITYSTKDDMNYLLKDIIYHYNFVVEIDGELYTHQTETLTTNHADDKFMFQVQPVELTKETATVSVEITNPTMSCVAKVGCRVYTPQGIQLVDEEKTVDTTDQFFSVDFDLHNGDEDLPSSEQYEYEFYINYNGTEYNSLFEEFTTLP